MSKCNQFSNINNFTRALFFKLRDKKVVPRYRNVKNNHLEIVLRKPSDHLRSGLRAKHIKEKRKQMWWRGKCSDWE